MPLPRRLARYNRVATNRLLTPFVKRLPNFGIVVHSGRKSGRQYRTPVMLFKRPRGYVIALTYGRRTQWVQNVLAYGGCKIETRRSERLLTQPTLVHDEQRRGLPAPVRFVLRVIKVSDFLELTLDDRRQAGRVSNSHETPQPANTAC